MRRGTRGDFRNILSVGAGLGRMPKPVETGSGGGGWVRLTGPKRTGLETPSRVNAAGFLAGRFAVRSFGEINLICKIGMSSCLLAKLYEMRTNHVRRTPLSLGG